MKTQDQLALLKTELAATLIDLAKALKVESPVRGGRRVDHLLTAVQDLRSDIQILDK